MFIFSLLTIAFNTMELPSEVFILTKENPSDGLSVREYLLVAHIFVYLKMFIYKSHS